VLDRFVRFLRVGSAGPATAAPLRFNAQLLVSTLESIGEAVAAQWLSAGDWETRLSALDCRRLALGRRPGADGHHVAWCRTIVSDMPPARLASSEPATGTNPSRV
jgi:hypothetical protein